MIDPNMLKMLDPEMLAQIRAAFGPSPDETRAANMAGITQTGLGMLGARKGLEFAQLGYAGSAGLAARDDALRSAREQRLGAFGMARDLTRMSRDEAEYQEKKARERAMEAARQSSVIPGSPIAPAIAKDDEGGSMPAAGMSPPRFDYGRYADAIAPHDVEASLRARAAMQKESELGKLDQKDWTPASFAKYMRTQNRGDLVPIAGTDEWKDIPAPAGTDPGVIWQQNLRTGQKRQEGTRAPKGTSVSVTNVQESAFAKKVGEESGDAYVKLQTAARAAGTRMQNLSAIQALLTDVKTDATTPIGMKIAGLAKGFGLELDQNLGRKQAADAIANKLALESRNTADGAGMPGAMSDKDREFLRAMNPNLEQTPEGRRMLIEIQRRLALRDQEVARIARRYVDTHKKLDGGFYDELERTVGTKDLFADFAAKAASANPGGRQVSGAIGSGAPAGGGWSAVRER